MIKIIEFKTCGIWIELGSMGGEISGPLYIRYDKSLMWFTTKFSSLQVDEIVSRLAHQNNKEELESTVRSFLLYEKINSFNKNASKRTFNR